MIQILSKIRDYKIKLLLQSLQYLHILHSQTQSIQLDEQAAMTEKGGISNWCDRTMMKKIMMGDGQQKISELC